ncbi:MAG: dehydratase [Ilumatobacteraceae bacterium]
MTPVKAMTPVKPCTVLDGETAVRAAVGSDLGASAAIEITAERLEQFASATGTGDPTYLAISLSNMFLPEIVEVRGFALGINYGTETVRFGPPLVAGDWVRAQATLVDVIEVRGGIQTRMIITVSTDVDGSEPICVIESLSRWLEPTR